MNALRQYCPPVYPGTSAASTTGASVTPVVSVAPCLLYVAPSAAVRCSTDANARSEVEAPTVVTHGPAWLAVPPVGPSFPADAFTLIPASYASRNASSTGSV